MDIYLVMKRDRPGPSYYPCKAFLHQEDAEHLHQKLTPQLPGRRSYVKTIELVGEESPSIRIQDPPRIGEWVCK